eukprot:753320-Hanusia_phi.AAC.1
MSSLFTERFQLVSDLFLSSRLSVYFASWGYSTPGQKASVRNPAYCSLATSATSRTKGFE